MDIVPQRNREVAGSSDLAYQDVLRLKSESVWRQIENVSVKEAIFHFLETLSPNTQKTYQSAFNRLEEDGLMNFSSNLQAFSLINHETVIDKIKHVSEWKEATKQARAAAYISFTKFLSRRTEGVVRHAVPSKEGASKTFFKVREKVTSRSMSRAEWSRFFEALDTNNKRESLIGKLALQGGKRISEVLSINTDDIDWEERRITFQQTKTKGLEKYTVITYPQHIIDDLAEYLGRRVGTVFVTRNGKSVHRSGVWRVFVKAGKRAGLPFRVTPHVLRASCVTYLKSQGFSDSDIMEITGHASAEMVNAYDKREIENNISGSVSLV